ncbi:hypothetical protein FKM82_000419 [Ascaphus truei]
MEMSVVALDVLSLPPTSPQPGCLSQGMALPLAPERGNGSVQPFTSPAFRLTESIRQDRPHPNLLPLLQISLSLSLFFSHFYIRLNYFHFGMPELFPG